MGQSKDGVIIFKDPPKRGLARSGDAVAMYEKAPQEQATGQTTPQVGDDLVKSLISERDALQQEEVDPDMRMAADIFDSELAKSIALESSRTKYGPGQLSKSPGSGSYLGEASYPAGRTS